MFIKINRSIAVELGKLMASMVGSIEIDYFLNPDFYPPSKASRRDIVAYFLVMVAIDHRLDRPGKPYEAIVDGSLYRGSDLLYKLGSKRFSEDPGFFEASNLSRITPRDVMEWLSVKMEGRVVKPLDPMVRAELLRDLGVKLERLFNGDPYNIILESKGYLRGEDGGGFINMLKIFKAYHDPVEKKAFLLAKFLERRDVLQIIDHYNKEVPVDNHLVRIALRIGLVEVDDETLESIAAGIEFDMIRDVMLRIATRAAYKEVAIRGSMDPFILDDLLRSFGRKCCTKESPTCRSSCRMECSRLNGCNGGCTLAPICLAYRNPKLMVPEHKFTKTFWY